MKKRESISDFNQSQNIAINSNELLIIKEQNILDEKNPKIVSVNVVLIHFARIYSIFFLYSYFLTLNNFIIKYDNFGPILHLRPFINVLSIFKITNGNCVWNVIYIEFTLYFIFLSCFDEQCSLNTSTVNFINYFLYFLLFK